MELKKEYIGVADVRNNFRDVIDEVVINGKIFIITSKYKDKAAIVPLSFLEKYYSEKKETNSQK